VRLHVSAKRYLTAIDPNYYDGLSPASVLSLELQGGPFSSEEARRFAATAGATDAIRLRRWDESSKRQGMATRDLEHFRPYVAVSLSDSAR
jgi:gamma-butyrobetaine dioxygenase